MILKSNAVSPSKAIGIVYSRDLRKLVKAMIKDYKSLIAIYRDKKSQLSLDADESKVPSKVVAGTWLTTEIQERLASLGKKWEKKFLEAAEYMSPAVVKRMLKANDTQIKRALIHFYSEQRLELIGNVIPTSLKQIMKAHINENANMIKSIQAKFREQVEGSVWRSITNRGSIESLKDDLVKYGVKTEERANLIALDQTRKMYSNMTLERFKQVGIKKVEWLHTHGGKTVRPYHYRRWDGNYSDYPKVNGLNGLIFEINNPPVIQEATKNHPEIRGYPSQLAYCTCVMRAVIEE